MAESDALQQATARLSAAVDALEEFLGSFASDDDSVASLKVRVHALVDERDRLLAELETERNRVQRLQAASDEVTNRLEAVMGTLRGMAPAG
jgi:chromosome segregation ATPase